MPTDKIVKIAALAHFGGLLRCGGDANAVLNLIRALTLEELRKMEWRDMELTVREAENDVARIEKELKDRRRV